MEFAGELVEVIAWRGREEAAHCIEFINTNINNQAFYNVEKYWISVSAVG